MTIGDPKVQTFLATKAVVVLATTQSDGSPLAMPMWFVHDPETVTMLSVEASQKVRNLRRDPRVCLVAESGTRGDIRGVAIQGQVQFLVDSAERQRLVEQFHAKYRPDLERRWGGRAMPPSRAMFRIIPGRVRAWGLT